jgi:hypothetical protein
MMEQQGMSEQEDSLVVVSLVTKPVVGRSLPAEAINKTFHINRRTHFRFLCETESPGEKSHLPLFAELAFAWPPSTKW